ncbi:hypothetical protein AR457_16190 [Streptomyces agglomeratus]|uniref:Uncharacterized protein n=1 Tax=Streptomyces agglomeratus TaxID=285458 RepID=A0A1E5P8C2_9ACTN|nr:hypothetical protein [Streptomyces agglomeratus]OEJ25780.1 hypothetical protein AS594_16040 [Streptomyces agglomeratus]OEJ40181.1 hypothetical protein BGK70_20465 [Streptomyces agglomeratus]OEJ45440.1 hypothetical protein AR457_16190 [Streptomyces agglomeratus]
MSDARDERQRDRDKDNHNDEARLGEGRNRGGGDKDKDKDHDEGRGMDPGRGGDDPKQAAPSPQDEPAPEAWEAVEQLFALAPHLRAGRANVMGDTRVSGDVVAGDKHMHLHGVDGPARLRPVGPVPAADLERVALTFAPNRRYDELCADLADQRVLVLRGRRGTGRRTAALRMMTQVAKDADVIALDPGTEPAEFADHVRPGRAHFVMDPLTSEDGPLRDVHLHAVRRRLADSNGLFVVVASPGTVLDGPVAYDWEPPGPADVVHAHLAHLMRPADSPDSSGPADPAGIRRLLELDETVRYLSASPMPQEAAGFARLLAAYAEGRCGAEELSGYGRTSAEAVVDAWFGGGAVELRDKAFLISLAAFDGSPYPLVADLGDRLYGHLRAAEEPDRPAGCSAFGTSRSERLALARAREFEDETVTPWGVVAERVVAFENSHIWSAVLRHVWTSHPAARGPVLEWLDALVADQRALVRLRGAVTAGVLAGSDFGYAFDRFLGRWASSPALMERQLAAWALYTAAEHGMDTVVRRLLSNWSGHSDQGRRWTVARTYALLGGPTAATALRDIGRMATSATVPDAALGAALEQTLEALLQGPAATTVLERLGQWQDPRGPLRELAVKGFLRGTARRRAEPGAGTAWPRLLWLADRDPLARRYVVVLWRELFGDRTVRDEARRAFARWVRAAETASSRAAAHGAAFPGARAAGHGPVFGAAGPEGVSDVEEALSRLLPELVVTANDRDRMDYLLRRLCDDGGQPGPAAGRLRDALHGGAPRSGPPSPRAAF